MYRLLLLFLFFYFTSCSGVHHKDPPKKFEETVSINSSTAVSTLDISQGNEHNTYGPVLAPWKQVPFDKVMSDKKPVLALDLVPSLYASLAYLSLFRQLERKNISPNIINTSSFTLIVALLYAKYQNVNKVEWQLFTLLKSLKDVNVFSSSWNEKIKAYVLEEFKNLRIEQLKILVTVPESSQTKKLIKTGKISEVVTQSLSLNKKKNFINSPHDEYRRQIYGLGADLFFTVNSLPQNIFLKTPNGFLWGLYSKLLGMTRTQKSVFPLEHKFQIIDTVPNVSDLFSSSSASAQEIAEKISQEYEQWIKKNN